MKANEAPEKIYISNFDIEALPKNEQLSERWHEVSTQDTDIEYTRTDAFIEKACKYFRGCLEDTKVIDDYRDILVPGIQASYTSVEEFIEDFKTYMKGE